MFGASFDHVEQPDRAGLVAHWGQVDDDGDVLVAAADVTPDMFVDSDHRHIVETVRSGDE